MAKKRRGGSSVQRGQLQIQKTNDGIKVTGIDPAANEVVNINTRDRYGYRSIMGKFDGIIDKIVSEVWKLICEFPGEAIITCRNGVLTVSYTTSRSDYDREQFVRTLARDVKTHVRTGF